MNDAINHTACETLFTQARTHNGWLDKPVSDAQLQAKIGSVNGHLEGDR
ncbi:hypothetical protein ACLBQR_11630, partial [Klebsiella pneumoniae]